MCLSVIEAPDIGGLGQRGVLSHKKCFMLVFVACLMRVNQFRIASLYYQWRNFECISRKIVVGFFKNVWPCIVTDSLWI